MLSKKVFCFSGFMVLILEEPRPSRPSDSASWRKEPETRVASSMACCLTTAPPMLTSSNPATPDAWDLSPYLIWKDAPGISLKVLDFEGS